MRVGAFCNRRVIVVAANDTVTLAARLMRDHHVGCVVVTDGSVGSRKPIGIVTDRDIVVSVVALERDALRTTVEQVMSAGLYRAREQEELEEVVQAMRGRGLRRVPVVDEEGHLQGIFTLDDVLDWTAEQMVELSRLVQREQHLERLRST